MVTKLERSFQKAILLPKFYKMRPITFFSIILVITIFSSFCQDSVVVVQKGQILKYRKGYIITKENDTLRGLIWHESDGKIFFIRDGMKIKTPIMGNFSSIPFYTADDGSIKGFTRNGLVYIVRQVPPDNAPVFVNLLESGPLNLYYLLFNYSDQQQANQMVNTGVLQNMANNAEGKTEAEYYDVMAYYLQKKADGPLIFIPKGEKKFRDAFIPLIRDNPVFVRGLAGQAVDYFHLHELVKQYNVTFQPH